MRLNVKCLLAGLVVSIGLNTPVQAGVNTGTDILPFLVRLFCTLSVELEVCKTFNESIVVTDDSKNDLPVVEGNEFTSLNRCGLDEDHCAEIK